MRKLIWSVIVLLVLCQNSFAVISRMPEGLGTSNGVVGAVTVFQDVFGGTDTWSTNEGGHIGLAGSNGTIGNLRVYLMTAGGMPSGQNATFTLMKNIVATSLTCVISSPTSSCSDVVDSVSVSAGDLLDLKVVQTGASTRQYTFSIDLLLDPSGVSVQGGGSDATNLSATLTQYLCPFCVNSPNATETSQEDVVPLTGTLSNFYVQVVSAPGGSASRAFTLRLNETSPTGGPTCTISGASRTCSDTTNTVAVVPGNRISISSVPTSSPTATFARYGMRVLSTTRNEHCLSVSSGANSSSTTATRYMPLTGVANPSNQTLDSTTNQTSGGVSFKNMQVSLLTAPGAGKSYTFTLRSGGTNTSLACTVSGTSTSCSSGGSVLIPSGTLMDTSITPSGTPAASTFQISYTVVNARRSGLVD